MRKERVRTRGFRGVGSFILGCFIGFICTILILAGLGYWAYTSISVGTIEKWTNSEITDNKEIESITLKKVLGIVQGVASSGPDAYTIQKFEEDFNVTLLQDSMYGVSLSAIKNSPITNLRQALTDTINTITFANVLSFMEMEDDLGLFNTVLDGEIKYYIYNGALYTSSDYLTPVDFSYSIEGDQVKIASSTHTIKLENGYNIITPSLKYLPFKTAISSVQEVTKGLKIYEILGYTVENVDGEYIYKDNGVEVEGLMASIAGYTIEDLSNKDTVNNLYIYEIMGYSREGVEGNYIYTNNGEEVTGVMATIAGKTLGELSSEEAFNDVTVADVLGYKILNDVVYDKNNIEVTGIMKHLANSTINELSTDIEGLTVGEILDIEYSSTQGIIKALYNSNITNLEDNINNLTLGLSLGVEENEATGIIKALYNTKITDLNQEINNLKVYQIMGYYYNDSDGKYYESFDGTNYTNKVEGIMQAIADSNINDLSVSVNNLKAKDVFDVETTTILNLFTPTELETLTIMDMPSAVVDKINDENTTIGDLLDCGVIVVEGEVAENVRAMTLEQLLTTVTI